MENKDFSLFLDREPKQRKTINNIKNNEKMTFLFLKSDAKQRK